MSALAMILAAGMMVPGNGPEKASAEMERGLDLRGEWEGTWQNPATEAPFRVPVVYAYLKDDTLHTTRRDNKGVPFRIVDEGGGKCRVTVVGKPQPVIWPGICKQEGDHLLLCFGLRAVRPSTLEPGRGEILLDLRRVKPSK